MRPIEQIADDFLNAYNLGNEDETLRKANNFARVIKRSDGQFMRVEHTYAVARAMYYLLRVDDRLSNDDCRAIVRLIYYCLLRNYSDNSDALSTDIKYADLVGGCELAFIIMCNNGEFLMYQILSGALGYLPNMAERYMVDQMFLFGGIVKEANEKGFHHFSDAEISRYFNSLLQEVYESIPSGEELIGYKDEYAPIIKTISKELEMSFRDEDYNDVFFI